MTLSMNKDVRELEIAVPLVIVSELVITDQLLVNTEDMSLSRAPTYISSTYIGTYRAHYFQDICQGFFFSRQTPSVNLIASVHISDPRLPKTHSFPFGPNYHHKWIQSRQLTLLLTSQQLSSSTDTSSLSTWTPCAIPRKLIFPSCLYHG